MPLKYEQRTKYDQQRNAEETRKGNDIAPLPKVVNKKRREACRLNLRLFCETYFPRAFRLKWSRDHLRVIAKIESAVLKGRAVGVRHATRQRQDDAGESGGYLGDRVRASPMGLHHWCDRRLRLPAAVGEQKGLAAK
jgi:hypothetical protein